MTGHIIATRQASGAQQVFRDAIEAGEFIFRHPFTEKEAALSNDQISLSRAYRGEAVNITTAEAALLQGFPEGFEFSGNKGERGLVIGNAVPPPVAAAALRAVWS